MTLVSTKAIVDAAARSHNAAVAFNFVQLETMEAIIAGAEQAVRPVILQISQNAVRYHGSLAPVLAAAQVAAEGSSAAVSVHLDHIESEELISEGLRLGARSVMFDASTLPYRDNVARTAIMARACHLVGAWIEAELGEVGGKDGAHAPGQRTDPVEAVAFVAETGVDALAVAVGSSHAMTTRDAALDVDLIARLRQTVPVPLVLHGSSGVEDHLLRTAATAGMAKVNIGTHLSRLMTASVRTHLADPAIVDPRRYLGPPRAIITAEVARILQLLSPELVR